MCTLKSKYPLDKNISDSWLQHYMSVHINPQLCLYVAQRDLNVITAIIIIY